MKEETKVLFVRFGKDELFLLKGIEKIAKDQFRSTASVAKEAIKEFLEKKKK